MDWDNSYWSPGKLLLTSEYLVIDGAKALAIPTKFGQDLKVKRTSSGKIKWTSYTDQDEVWLEVVLNSTTLNVLSTNDKKKAEKLSAILSQARALSTNFPNDGAIVETKLDFPRNWGLGSSSTLLCNIAKWLSINAFQLHFQVSNGSGYDIACGLSDEVLTYQLLRQTPHYELIEFTPTFLDQIYFIHLNQKQFSDKEVARYSTLKSELNLKELTSKFSDLTDQFVDAKTLNEFESLIVEHEQLLSHILQQETISESLFQMYSGGVIKSLGAWGGDFVMVTAANRKDLDYFRNKGYCTIISYKDIIK
ncbi:GYDIA family GHMP kinase [Parvicella tangerina]|uniref:GHMP kinase n=1 Tax=Parvicella tangerina TaxID=2829795 RepID=A0A916JMR9_9FLAO|nr:GYDIA family GHMP kinase [Parvicella tangerina]CAG5082568.1 hypothetical protein CRYO30217_01954 [Parvicella tangerina]